MGLYDGVGGVTDRASAWHVARTLDLPVLLVVRPKGASLTLAAQIRGLRDFRPNSRIAGVILNDCAPALWRSLGPMMERETDIPVLGCLPHLPEAAFGSRHLGLYTAAEIQDLELSENPVPNWTALTAQYASGYLTVPVVGAGTANTECGGLTGMSPRLFGPGE